MAQNPIEVTNFMSDLLSKSKPAAQADVDRVKELAKKDGISDLQPWDFSFYAEKLKQKELNLDEEKIKPYFELNNVINGVFNVARILYGYDFELRDDIETYHKDVLTYEVLDRNGEHKAIFYADFFPRAGKRDGAWMTSFAVGWCACVTPGGVAWRGWGMRDRRGALSPAAPRRGRGRTPKHATLA